MTEDLLSWLRDRGGTIGKVDARDLGEAGFGLVGTDALDAGTELMRVPLSICMTAESAQRDTGLRKVIAENPWLLEQPDELLALHLMVENLKDRGSTDSNSNGCSNGGGDNISSNSGGGGGDGGGSFWSPYLRSLPRDSDAPLWWSDKERQWLQGTMCLALTVHMERQMRKDWAEAHAPLVARYPRLMGGITYDDYLWAMGSIWSRAFGYVVPAGSGGGVYKRALVPGLNIANHDPRAARSLSEVVDFAAGAFVLRTNRPHAAGEQVFILYGPYSNSRLLYTYGFVVEDNPFRGVDFWVRVPPTCEGAERKAQILASHALTARGPTFDFRGTLCGDRVAPALLATLRVIYLAASLLDRGEESVVARAFRGEMVSAENEAAALRGMAVELRAKLAAYRPSEAEDRTLLRQLVPPPPPPPEGTEAGAATPAAAEGAGCLTPPAAAAPTTAAATPPPPPAAGAARMAGATGTARRRLAMAVRVRLEDKATVRETLALVEAEMVALREKGDAYVPLDHPSRGLAAYFEAAGG